MPELGCPAPEDILLWSNGLLVDSPRHDAIARHLGECVRCGQDLDIALGVQEWIVENASVPSDPPPPSPDAARVFRYRKQADRIFEGPPRGWWQRLIDHPACNDLRFLYNVADKAVWFSDEDPRSVLRFVKILGGIAEQSPGTAPDREAVLALVAIAEGTAHRTLGDYRLCFAAYTRGERLISNPALSIEAARLLFATGTALRLVNELDEAAETFERCQLIFARMGDELGQAKVLAELAALAWQRGDHRLAFKLGVRARKLLIKMGDENAAVVNVIGLVGALLGLGRLRKARHILLAIEGHEQIQRNPNDAAKVRWKWATLAMLEGDLSTAAAILEEVVHRHGESGNLRSMALALVELAEIHGRLRDSAKRIESAARAAKILATIGTTGDVAIALHELQEALRKEVDTAEVLVALRDRLRRTS
ncbi:MAG: hypothetical protein U0166_15000 [Acidobacteriota bacterium]